jgi:spore coat polysaccharide biosynthesis predicted glycosyltransferase SpsG
MHPASRIAAFADAGAEIGLGHLSRTSVVVRALAARGLPVVLATPAPTAGPAALAEAAGVQVTAADSPAALPAAPLVLLDSYRLARGDMERLQGGGARVVLLDDLADRPIAADLVVNPNIYGPDLDYRPLTGARVLAGLAWCPVDPRFAAARAAVRDGARALVAFGGTDDGGHALPLARALRARCDWPLEVVISPLRPLAPGLAEQLAALGDATLHHGADMAALMARCTHYAGAAGSTVWEALTAGLVPAVTAIADNQRRIVAALAAAGVPALQEPDPVGLAAALIDAPPDPPLSQLLDGRGAERLAGEIAALLPA